MREKHLWNFIVTHNGRNVKAMEHLKEGDDGEQACLHLSLVKL